MLASVQDLPRLVACGTDQARYNRMRGLIGADALAFTEISITQQCILAQPDPDLTSLALLRVQQDHLTNRYSFVPDELPAVWARIGQLTRAEALVNSVTDWSKRTQAWCSLVKVVAASGEHDRAARLADEAEARAEQITDPYGRVETLARLAELVAVAGDRDRAVRLAGEAQALIEQITEPQLQEWVLVELVAAVAVGDDYQRAKALARQITTPYVRARALTKLAAVVAAGSNRDRAARLVAEAEVLAGQITAQPFLVSVLPMLVEVVALCGARDRVAWWAGEAQALTGQITGPLQESTLVALVAAVAVSGDYERVEAIIGQITNPVSRAWALIRLAAAVAERGDRDRAARLAGKTEAFIWQITDQYTRVEALAGLAVAVAGDRHRAARLVGAAEALIGQITDPDQRESALVGLVVAVATGGDYERAEALAGQITTLRSRAEVMARLAGILVETSKEAASIPGHEHSSSSLMVRARHLLAGVLVTGSWGEFVVSLARVDPLAVTALADEVQARCSR